MALLTVSTTYGKMQGIPSCRNDMHTVFLSIPYARPPVGKLRFAPPEAPEPWKGIRICDTLPPACIQDDYRGCGAERMSEDCLYLNVFTPAKTPDEKLPVLFWIYGGGFGSGYSASPEFDGDAMNSLGAVVVTVNYRCGVFGFFSIPELDETHGFSGNVGLLDQIAALKWVKENIAAFGGDPERVLVFGQSAGGMSTRMLLCSPQARGLFSRAVIESGGGFNEADLVRPREEFVELCQTAMRHTGLTYDDLMHKDAVEIHQRMNQAARETATSWEVNYFQPFVDGLTLTRVPGESVRDFEYMDIPIINMTVSGDAWMFTRKVKEQLGDNMRLFRGFSYAPSQAWAQHQAATGRTPIYACYMDRTQPETRRAKRGSFGVNTPHSSEIAYIFGTLDVRKEAYEEKDYIYSHMLTAYWVNFAKTGNPNGEGLPWWPLYTKENPLTLHIGDQGIKAENVILSEDEQRALDYTKAHPGMLCSVDGI